MKVNVTYSKHSIVFYIVDAYMAFSHEVHAAARDKENQIAHVQKSRGSLRTTNMAANRDIENVLFRR